MCNVTNEYMSYVPRLKDLKIKICQKIYKTRNICQKQNLFFQQQVQKINRNRQLNQSQLF